MTLTLEQTERSLNLIRQMPVPFTDSESLKQDLREADKGSVLEIEERVWYVKAKHRYEEHWEGNVSKWYELKLVCLTTGETLFLEWEYDDELEVSLWKKEVALRKLGLTPDKLWEFDDEEDGEFSFSGKKYEYDDSGDVIFFKNNGDKGEKFYFWDFERVDDDDYGIGVECWGESEFLASIGYYIDSRDVRILVMEGGHATAN